MWPLTLAFGWLPWLFLPYLALCAYVAYDMYRRGQPGGLYGALVFFGGVVGILLWLILRSDKPVHHPSTPPRWLPSPPSIAAMLMLLLIGATAVNLSGSQTTCTTTVSGTTQSRVCAPSGQKLLRPLGFLVAGIAIGGTVLLGMSAATRRADQARGADRVSTDARDT